MIIINYTKIDKPTKDRIVYGTTIGRDYVETDDTSIPWKE